MNKKIFPLFSLLLMLALAVASFAPAYAAPSALTVIKYNEPVKLAMTYNPATHEIIVSAAFVDPSLKIGYGVVSVRSMSPNLQWSKTAKRFNVNRIVLRSPVPRGGTGVRYCASAQLYVSHTIAPDGVPPLPRQGSAYACFFVPRPPLID